jgi:hypothetical protein
MAARARAGAMHGHHKYFVDPRPPRKSENTACMYVEEHWFTHSDPHYDLWWPIVQEAPYMIYADRLFYFKSSRWCIGLLDIGGSMGTVPRQESVSNSSMHHRELLKWHCRFVYFSAPIEKYSGEGWWICFARAARARARGTRAHVRNVPSSVLLKSTVQNFIRRLTGRRAIVKPELRLRLRQLSALCTKTHPAPAPAAPAR